MQLTEIKKGHTLLSFFNYLGRLSAHFELSNLEAGHKFRSFTNNNLEACQSYFASNMQQCTQATEKVIIYNIHTSQHNQMKVWLMWMGPL